MVFVKVSETSYLFSKDFKFFAGTDTTGCKWFIEIVNCSTGKIE
jgi:hypothetical protein